MYTTSYKNIPFTGKFNAKKIPETSSGILGNTDKDT
jgi:hypothetical protein